MLGVNATPDSYWGLRNVETNLGNNYTEENIYLCALSLYGLKVGLIGVLNRG